MNIKKRIRLEANDKIAHLIREKYARPNVYANKNNKGMLLIISFCSLIVTALIPFSIVGIKALLSTSNNNYSSRSSPDQGGSYVKPWIERSIFQKYPILVYEDNYYSISSEYNFQFPNEKVGIEISDSATISSKDYQSNENHEEVVRLFSIEKIDTRVAILVKFKSDVNYYPYCSVDAYFNSLDELLNGYDLYNSISFDNSFFIYKSKNSIYRYDSSSLNKSIIWETVFNNTSLINKSTIINEMNIKEDEQIDLAFSIPLLGLDPTPNMGPFIKLFPENKYVYISILDASFLFEVEDDSINELFSYLVNNFKK